MEPFTIISTTTKKDYIRLYKVFYILTFLLLLIFTLKVYHTFRSDYLISHGIYVAQSSVVTNSIILLICFLAVFYFAVKRYRKSFIGIKFHYSFDSEGIIIQGNGRQWRYRWENILYVSYKNNDITIHTSKLHAFRISLNNLSEAQFRWIMSSGNAGNKIVTPFMEKIELRYIAIGILLTIYFVAYSVIEADRQNAQVQKDVPPQEYLNLFLPLRRSEIKTKLSYSYKSKNEISFFFKDDYYNLLIYKIGKLGDVPLTSLLKTQVIENNIDVSLFKNQVHYYQIPYVWRESDYEFYRSNDSLQLTSIFAMFNCDSLITSISNDSVVSYNLRLSDFLMKYQENGEIDFVVAIGEFYKKQSFNVMFLKKKGQVYLLMMCPVNKNVSLQKDALYDLINQ